MISFYTFIEQALCLFIEETTGQDSLSPLEWLDRQAYPSGYFGFAYEAWYHHQPQQVYPLYVICL